MRRGPGAAGSGRGGILRFLTALLFLLAPCAALAQGGVATGPRVLAADSVRVVFWPRSERYAREVLADARRPLSLPGFPARRAPLPATIILAPSQAVWDSLLGGVVPEWGAGVAIPSEQTIFLPLFASPRTNPGALGTTLRHELIHLALHRELPQPVPRWFDEGYAQWASGGWDEERAWQLRVAFLMGRAPPLDSLSLAWPAGEERARLAYLLSATAVRHLAERSGPDGFEVLIRAWQREGTLERAIRSAYGMTMGQFEEEWAGSVRRRYGWLLLGTQMTVFWLGATLCLFVLFYIRKRRDRAKLAEMRAEERMLPPPREDGVDVEYPLE